MKRKTVHWADDVRTDESGTGNSVAFKRVIKALKDKNMNKATEILKSLPAEEANAVIHQNDGEVIEYCIRVAHLNMLNHVYNKGEFINLYTILVNLDQEYVKSKTSEANKQIREKRLERINLKLFILCRDMDEVYAKKATFKAVHEVICSGSGSESVDSTENHEAVVAPETTDCKTSSVASAEVSVAAPMDDPSSHAVSAEAADVKVDDGGTGNSIAFKQVKKALKDKNMNKATEILKSLPAEEANAVIHQNDGEVIECSIRLAYSDMRHNKYDKVKFTMLYKVLVNLDLEYTRTKALAIIGEMVEKASEQNSIKLFVLGKHIDEASREMETFKAVHEVICSGSGSESVDSTENHEAVVAPETTDCKASSVASAEVSEFAAPKDDDSPHAASAEATDVKVDEGGTGSWFAFTQVKKALAKDNNMSKAAKILKSLPVDVANEVIHQDDGKVIKYFIRLAYSNMKHNKHNTIEFITFYKILAHQDHEYIKSKISAVAEKLLGRLSLKDSYKLFALGGDMDQAEKEIKTLAAARSEADCKAASASAEVSVAAPMDDPSSHADHAEADTKGATDAGEFSSLKDDIIEDGNILPLFTRDKINGQNEENNSYLPGSSYIINFFFGWLNNLPDYIRASIQLSNPFQTFLEHYSKMLEMSAVVKISVEFAEEAPEDKTFLDDNDIGQEVSAEVQFDKNNFIDTSLILALSSASLPIIRLSGIHHDYDVPVEAL